MSEGAAVVIGAGDGLGAVVTRAFAGEGLTVVPSRRKAESLDRLVAETGQAGGKAVGLACDARAEDEVIALFDRVEAEVRPACAAGFGAFAGAKRALKALPQSMARELGPKGIHVAHVIVDGQIDTSAVRARFPERVAAMPEDGLMSPDAIAANYVMLYRKPRSSWTFELDPHPWTEGW